LPEATKLRQLIKDIVEKIKECMDKHPDRLAVCADFITQFNDLSGQLLQKLTRLIHGMGTLGPAGVVQVVRANRSAPERIYEVLESLIDCRGCDNIK
jgi:hypothetical protein